MNQCQTVLGCPSRFEVQLVPRATLEACDQGQPPREMTSPNCKLCVLVVAAFPPVPDSSALSNSGFTLSLLWELEDRNSQTNILCRLHLAFFECCLLEMYSIKVCVIHCYRPALLTNCEHVLSIQGIIITSFRYVLRTHHCVLYYVLHKCVLIR